MKVEEIYRIDGKELVTITHSKFLENYKFYQFHDLILNKEELNELVNWLISKMDEL